MNVFLSHSTKDADFVQRLATTLEANGFTPWLCEVDIEKGANFVAKINEGLAQSDLALLVWSPDAAKSAWTEQEWTTLLARQVEEQRTRLGIIRLHDGNLPELLRTSNWIDARSNQEAGIEQAVAWLRDRQSAQRLSGFKAPVILEAYPTDDLFVGRTSYLKRLRDAFSEGPARFLLHGVPGAGKSTLALRFGWEAQKDFDAVVFQRCGQRSVEEIAADLAYKLSAQLGEQVLQLPPEKKLEVASEWLRGRQSLLVLDDVRSVDVKQLEPGGPCSVLHTSQQQSLPWISATHTSEVVSFSDDDCESLFHASLDDDFGTEEVTRQRDTLLGFAARVERLPIAVAVGASLLRQKKASGLHRGALRLRLDELHDGVRDVPGLFWKAIASQPEREQRLLAACAVCVQEGFWLPLAAVIAELSQDEAVDAADRLIHSSLLRLMDGERGRFQLHGLLRDEVHAWQGDDGLAKLQERHAVLLEKLFEGWETRWQECRECLDEVIPAARFLWQLRETRRGAQLSFWAFELAKRTGELEAAFRIAKEEESLLGGRNDPEAQNTLSAAYGSQALILRRWGRLEEAMVLLEQQAALYRELGNDGGLSKSYSAQALILQDLGLWNEAMTVCQQEEVICSKLGDQDGLSRSYGNQAVILQELGQLNEALAVAKQQEAICRQLGNKNGLQLSYGNQAEIQLKRRKLEEALALLKKQEAICLELGIKSSLGICYYNWGLLARAQGDRTTEKEKLEQALAIFTELKMPRERDAVQEELEGRG